MRRRHAPGRIAAALWLIAALIGVSARHARAVESAPVASSRSAATLITDTDVVAPDAPFHAALRLRLAPGWHTYWMNPGDAGYPPSLTLSLPPGASASNLEFPVPQRLLEGTLTAYGYTGDVILPFSITPGQDGLRTQAHVEWLACKDVCVPEQADFSLDLKAGHPAPSAQAAMITSALAKVPVPAPFTAVLTTDALTLSGLYRPISSVEFFPSQAGTVNHTAPQSPKIRDGKLSIRIDPALRNGQGVVSGVVALTEASGATSAYIVQPQRVLESEQHTRWAVLVLLALAGGMLLNLMPCVFPILAMKAVALSRLSNEPARRVRWEAGSYSAGVVAAFTALGALLVALRSAGNGVGWGFQFQSPIFVTAIAWLLFSIGLSLSGVFAIGSGLAGTGHGLSRKGGHFGSFLTGILAVVVASPCTAPFMGSAVAGALALSNPAALTVFAALGAGLALPYLLIAIVPALSRALPRPGRWMATLQQALAFPMYSATVWLVWVLSQQAGPTGVLTAGAGLVLVGVAAWLGGRPASNTRWGVLIPRVATAFVVAGLVGLLTIGPPDGSTALKPSEPFTVARLDTLRDEQRPVFVNLTAAWCLSCLVNEKLALSPAAVQQALVRANVAYLKGDWTSQDPAIAAYLHQLGQDGVPLYVMYAPGRPPLVLPQILSQATMLDAIAGLKG